MPSVLTCAVVVRLALVAFAGSGYLCSALPQCHDVLAPVDCAQCLASRADGHLLISNFKEEQFGCPETPGSPKQA